MSLSCLCSYVPSAAYGAQVRVVRTCSANSAQVQEGEQTVEVCSDKTVQSELCVLIIIYLVIVEYAITPVKRPVFKYD